EQLKACQEEKELERQNLQEEMVGYKEQSKQHSLTIVALEDRLMEAKQQQKALEEENAALVAKMEGRVLCPAGCRGNGGESPSGAWLEASPVTEPHCWLREELAAAQSSLLSKDAVITGLTRELAETRARMSDVRGELSEEQKVQLEQNLSRVKCQERELNLLREKLSQMSSLVEKKDRALKAAAEELRWMKKTPRGDQLIQQGCISGRFKLSLCSLPRHGLGENQLCCLLQKPASDLAELGVQCRGLRHEETIRRQKEGLAELRERIKMLEKSQSPGDTKKGLEPLVLLTKDVPEKIAQKMGLEKDPMPMLGAQVKAGEVPGAVPNWGSHRAADGAASSAAADATDLGEQMYLDVISALGRLLKVQELAGMQPLKHLPQEERERAGLRRRKNLELLYEKIRSLKSRLERKEAALEGYEASVEQLRETQASLQRCREEMSQLEDEAYRAAEEKALLKEALERTRLQLSQEKQLLRAAK
ncbi:FHAD1 protein, partial [Zapornia atra]|nr:FHAD1 protein [Zapornia atra]